jgi:hypothetical protein
LLRSNQADRLDALTKGVQGGIYAPNEARQLENLPAVEFGDEPRVQQQVVPLSAAASIQPDKTSSTPPAPGPPAPPPASPPVPPKGNDDELRRQVRHILASANRRKHRNFTGGMA